MRILFEFPFQREYISEMDEDRMSVLTLVWDFWRPRLIWISY